MDERKVIYKVKYEIEIEITETKSEEGRMITVMPEMDIKQEVIIRNFDTSNINDSATCDYIEKHFPEEIENLWARMFALESLVMGTDSLDVRSALREIVISQTEEMVNKSLRKRLTTTKGRKPDKAKKDYTNNKKQFKSDCVEILKKMRNEKIPLNQPNFADRYFTDKYRENQVKPLFAKLKLYGISWKKLKAEITQ